MDPRSTDGEDFVTADDHPTDGMVPGESPPLSVLFDALSNSRSRYVLYYLLDRADAEVPLSDLVSAVEAREPEDVGGVGEEFGGYRTAFHHHHLPKLADAGLVEYDQDAETVAFVGELDRIEPYLSLSRRADEPISDDDRR